MNPALRWPCVCAHREEHQLVQKLATLVHSGLAIAEQTTITHAFH